MCAFSMQEVTRTYQRKTEKFSRITTTHGTKNCHPFYICCIVKVVEKLWVNYNPLPVQDHSYITSFAGVKEV